MAQFDLGSFDLSQLPNAEVQEFEFKSSRTRLAELKNKMAEAASGFANSGGGFFVAGVDNNGDADGGFAENVGRQDFRDWADQVVHGVEPAPAYERLVLRETGGRGSINSGNVVLVIAIKESYSGPHMAPDKRYYIRAGAHTVPAPHFIVEAIWAKRHFRKPRLTHVLRLKPTDCQIVQVGIVPLTDAPAVDVHVLFGGSLQTLYGDTKDLRIPMIDAGNPFYTDLTTTREAWEGTATLNLRLTYRSLGGEEFTHEAPIELRRSIPPVVFSDSTASEIEKIRRALESIDKKLSNGR